MKRGHSRIVLPPGTLSPEDEAEIARLVAQDREHVEAAKVALRALAKEHGITLFTIALHEWTSEGE